MKILRRIPPKLVFIFTGIASTLWFLVRVIPKPSRAAYPCMRVAAPVMSGFVLYLLSLGGVAVFLRKAKQTFQRARYVASGTFLMAAMVAGAVFFAQSALVSRAQQPGGTGPADGPNQPMGQGVGAHPGRVVWVWDPEATNENCVNIFDLVKPENTNQGVVNRMVVDGILRLGGETRLDRSWDAIFRSFNEKKGLGDKAYSPGEKIFIKINQGTANGRLRHPNRDGFGIPARYMESDEAKKGRAGTCETYPSVVLELLRELVYVVGIQQEDIAIGDPLAHIYDYNYHPWSTEFPRVVYVDKSTENDGRTLIHPTKDNKVFYSDHYQSDKLYDVIVNADYLINVASMKPHGRAGISLTAKNHYGSHARRSAFHLHYSLISPVSIGNPSNAEYGKYRALVDLMGSKYLGGNTLLCVVDALYGGGAIETNVPVKYFMPPFNNDWSSSIFISQDQVALESVCYDFLRTEWNGTYSHNPANNSFESMPSVTGVDDYLHQAADPGNWPENFTYDPDGSGIPLGSLGVHEHWNNAAKKQYSGNLGNPGGIELISVPENLVGGDGPAVSTPDMWLAAAPEVEEDQGGDIPPPIRREHRAAYSFRVTDQSFGEAFKADTFYAITVDDNNTKWFLTDAGIVSFDGETWEFQDKNRKLTAQEYKDVDFDYSEYGRELWLATPRGATVASIPIDARSGATTYYGENSPLVSENVVSIAVGYGSIRWFGTDKGISAFRNDKWLEHAYDRKYPEYMFEDFPITSMATTIDGDSLYVGTLGAGVTRVYRNDVDAISGASEYAQWGPIELPSDSVYSIYVGRDGTQWFGTSAGAARHTGFSTLDNWTVYNEETGLIDNQVQAISVDFMGRVWFGTPNGVSIYDHVSWRTVTEKEGLTANNILCITVDRDGVVWLGTNKGLTSYSEGTFTRYRNKNNTP